MEPSDGKLSSDLPPNLAINGLNTVPTGGCNDAAVEISVGRLALDADVAAVYCVSAADSETAVALELRI